jgi:hypothetical protein
MNLMKTTPAGFITAGLTALMCFALAPVRAETAYFLMSGPMPRSGNESRATESYVVAVTEPLLIQQARTHLASGAGALFLIPHVTITLGGDGINRNYADEGHPPWDWHATELIGWTTYDPSVPSAAVYLPRLHSSPSRVGAELLSGLELSSPVREMSLVHFPLLMELSAGDDRAVINVSTRGWVGMGERVLIAGFVVEGGVPRNVLIRALGPSLSALGVVEALADPTLSVHRGAEKIGGNDDWVNGNFTRPPIVQSAAAFLPPLAPWYEWLFPTSVKEAAIRLSLAPGAYTVQISGGAGGTGVALVEVYDFDALAPRLF